MALSHLTEATTCICYGWLSLFTSMSLITCLNHNFIFLLLYWNQFVDLIYWLPVIIDKVLFQILTPTPHLWMTYVMSYLPILLYDDFGFISIHRLFVSMETLIKTAIPYSNFLSFLLQFLGDFLNFIFQPSYWFFSFLDTCFLLPYIHPSFSIAAYFCHVEALTSPLRTLKWVLLFCFRNLLFSPHNLYYPPSSCCLFVCLYGSPSYSRLPSLYLLSLIVC